MLIPDCCPTAMSDRLDNTYLSLWMEKLTRSSYYYYLRFSEEYPICFGRIQAIYRLDVPVNNILVIPFVLNLEMQSSKPTKINETVDIDNLRNEIAKIGLLFKTLFEFYFF